MSDLSQIVDSLENRISKLLHRSDLLRKSNMELQQELTALKKQKQEIMEDISGWKQKYETLKTANAMLGSDQYKRETKLKINALVRELDYCIAQMSE
ncbi:hypothetical protein [Gilvibacter sediminis]|uniref:hypothetical protein n=1 Tax=Gilvibacter sediminis TaxID=379071 RepID=UPI0023503DF4|nr:hypothetical protein [Gilvibacter sediminis]MDC7997788.1 hypothetical protein [Gilvibacter sediminis]